MSDSEDLDRLLELEEDSQGYRQPHGHIVVDCIACGRVIAEDMADPGFRVNFEVSVCDPCVSGGSEKLDKITKTKAKEEFLLTEDDLSALKFVEKESLSSKFNTKYKLYLRISVEKLMLAKYSSYEGLEQERQKKEVAKLERHVKKAAKSKAAKRKAKPETKAAFKKLKASQIRHEHVYDDSNREIVDEDECTYANTCTTCNIRIEYTEF